MIFLRYGSSMPTTLGIEQPKARKHAFVITQDGEQVGSLEYANVMHRQANAALYTGEWHFAHKGITDTKTAVTLKDTDDIIANFTDPLFKRKGVLSVEDETYLFQTNGMSFKSKYAWTDSSGDKLVTYSYGGFLKTVGEIAVAEAMLDRPERRFLIPLGLFLGLNQDNS